METKIETGLTTKMFDNFSLDCFRGCETLYHWRIQERLIRPSEKKTAASFGAAIHKAFEVYYGSGMTDDSISAAINAFSTEFIPDDQDEKRTLASGLGILMRYFERFHKKEPFTIVEGGVEVGGAFELGSSPYLYCYRIDLIVEWDNPKAIYIFDHKTSSALHMLQAKPNNQMTGYIYAASQHWENIGGLFINAIGVYKGEKTKDKVTGKMVEREIFQRIPTSRSSHELKTWEAETIHLIGQIERCEMDGVWAKNAPDRCKKYGGTCSFFDLCNASHPEEIKEALVESGVYVISAWTPYSVEGGDE